MRSDLSLLGGLVGHDFVAVHMAWGAANEWSANAAYLRLAKQEGHPVLAELLNVLAPAFDVAAPRWERASVSTARNSTRRNSPPTWPWPMPTSQKTNT